MITEQFKQYDRMLDMYGEDPRTVAAVCQIEASDFRPEDFIPAYERTTDNNESDTKNVSGYDWAMDEYGDPRLVSTAAEIAGREAHPEQFMTGFAGIGPREKVIPKGKDVALVTKPVGHTQE